MSKTTIDHNTDSLFGDFLCFIPTDRPTPPVGPVVFEEVHREFMVISWKPPLDSGGVDVSNYIIEKRDVNRDTWTTVTSATTKTVCKVGPDGLTWNSFSCYEIRCSGVKCFF